MRILLIDNTSVHIGKFESLLEGHTVVTVSYTEVEPLHGQLYDLIILSGGSKHALIGNEEKFAAQIELVRSTQTPIIGICFGFQLLAYAYGADIKKSSLKVRGLQQATIIDPHLKEKVGSEICVYQSHFWYVSESHPPLIPLITSATGVEAFKHIHKPQYGLQFHPEVTDESTDGKRVFIDIFSRIVL